LVLLKNNEMKKIIAFLVVLVFVSQNISAKIISTSSPLKSGIFWNTAGGSVTTIVQGSSPSVDPSGNILYRNKSLVSGVRLALNTTEIPILGAFNAEIEIKLDYFLDSAPTTPVSETRKLTINYDPTTGVKYKNIDVLYIPNAFKLTAIILAAPNALNISSGAISTSHKNFITIQAFTEQERFENLDNVFGVSPWTVPYIPPTITATYLGMPSNELVLAWTATGLHGEGYELEYTFVDDYSNTSGPYLPASGINFSFKNNSTRILVDKPPYKMQMIQEHGYLVYRIRPYTMAGSNFEQIIYGNYGAGTSGSGLFNVASFPNKHLVNLAQVHASDKINWQSVTSFAEETKSKTIVKYMDGTMRNRQTVTSTSTEKNAIVAETIYDFQGRPAVNVLPTPVAGLALRYYNNFNQNLAGTPYKYADFDTKGPGACDPYMINPLKQNGTLGAGTYYSKENPNKYGFNAFIPDANGYPFTKVNYMPDPTDRVVRQGNVGEYFQPGKTATLAYQNHDTKYYYAKPEQNILDILFGTEIGYNQYYQKNMVLDANGQASVSYVDLDGKTIATALAGEAPASVDQLESFDIIPINVDLLSGSDIINNIDHSITNAQSFLVTKNNTPYNFEYKINPQTYNALNCDTKTYCLDCIYDLEISLVNDECSKVEFIKTKSIGKIPSLDFICNNDITTTFRFDTLVNLNIGSYTITKKLIVNKIAAETYANNILNDPANTCLKTFDDFYAEAWAKRDTNRCKEACDACIAEASTLTGAEFASASNDCDSLWCNPNIGNTCDIARTSMISDLSPCGQYAIYLDGAGNFSPGASLISIFNIASDPAVKNIFSSGSVSVQLDGEPVYPLSHYFSPSDSLKKLIENWPDDLSEKLLVLHPEYCYLRFCNEPQIDLSNGFDTKYMNANTKANATSVGLFSGTTTADNFYSQDPFYTMLGATSYSTLQADMATKYNNFTATGSGISIKTLAVYLVNCPSGSSITSCTGAWGDGVNDDAEWQQFKLLYYSLKQEFFVKAREQYVINQGCCINSYIGCEKSKTPCTVYMGVWPSSLPLSIPALSCSTPYLTSIYGKADKRFVTINDIDFPGTPSLTTSIYNMSPTELQTYVNSSSATSPCPSCPEMDAFKAMIYDIQAKKYIYNNSTVTADAVGGLKDSLRVRFLGSLTSSSVIFNMISPTQFTISSHPRCTMTFTSDSIINWEKAVIIPICLGITDYKNATLNVMVDGVYKTKLTISSTCDIFYCAGDKPQQQDTSSNCICNENYNMGTAYTVGSIVKYDGKCYLLSKGNSLNTLSPGNSPPSEAYWTLLCEPIEICKDALNLDFDATVPFASALGLSPSLTNDKYAVQNSFSNAFTTVTYPNNVFLANPVTPSQIILSKIATVETNKKYSLNFNASLAFYSPGPAMKIEVLINGFVAGTYPALGTAWSTFTIPYVSGSSTSMDIKFRLVSNGKNILALDNIEVICLGSDYSSASKVAPTPPSSSNPRSPKRYIPENACNCNALCDMPLPSPPLAMIPCDSLLRDIATQQANAALAAYRDTVFNAILTGYYDRCMQSLETFAMNFNLPEYHYTLYYYDQSGNLIKTIPPAGVKPLASTSITSVRNSRKINGTAIVPAHIMPSEYKHNALDAVVWQTTPDAGLSDFFYDKLGRIVMSQNAEQKPDGKASYIYYDALGRNIEAGKIDVIPNDAVALKGIAYNHITWPAFVNSHARTEITRTYYDVTVSSSISSAFGAATLPNYLRNRISSVASYADHTKMPALDYEQASHYRYDISGNVIDLLQDYGKDSPFGNANIRAQSKRLQYSFDLIAGKVNALYYETGRKDQFIYKYVYNADNKLTEALTSKDGIIWEKDARYTYYRHGPLARTELGSDNVQGLDYVYNIHGWIKGINGISTDYTSDGGQDGTTLPTPGIGAICTTCPGPVGYTHEHNKFGKDAASYWLSYYQNDYKPIGQAEAPVSAITAPLLTGVYHTAPDELFNGNIRSMYTNLRNFGGMGMKYRYDQLNRIKNQDAYNFTSGTGVATPAYKMALTYDGNGNIKTLLRNGANSTGMPLLMDDLKYTYYNYNTITATTTGTYPTGSNPAAMFDGNRLAMVQDNPTYNANYVNDIDNQGGNNYTYDKIGNLTADISEGISSIKWNIQNKITDITKTTAIIKYAYDPTGKRIMKKVTPTSGTAKEDYYVLDPQGNTLAVYTLESTNLRWQEQHLYGSSRLGITKLDTLIPRFMAAISSGGSGGLGSTTIDRGDLTAMERDIQFTHTQRNKAQYEIANHLGNVLATVSDGKINTNTAQIISSTDYYAFGMPIPGRTLANNAYRYGMNGQQKDDEIFEGANSAEFWEYDSRIGRRWNIDPIVRNWESSYTTFGNNPIQFFDLWGLSPQDGDGEKGDSKGKKTKLDGGEIPNNYTFKYPEKNREPKEGERRTSQNGTKFKYNAESKSWVIEDIEIKPGENTQVNNVNKDGIVENIKKQISLVPPSLFNEKIKKEEEQSKEEENAKSQLSAKYYNSKIKPLWVPTKKESENKSFILPSQEQVQTEFNMKIKSQMIDYYGSFWGPIFYHSRPGGMVEQTIHAASVLPNSPKNIPQAVTISKQGTVLVNYPKAEF
jgi:hypothetical protein